MNRQLREQRQLTNRELVTCPHGLNSNENCWWCETTKNKPTEQRIDRLEEKFKALLNVVKLLALAPKLGRGGGLGTTIIQNVIEGTTLIESGLVSAKPDSNTLAFYMATDTDTIYQRRDGSWVDISFSRPEAPDVQVTDISVDGDTGALQITTPD